MLELSLHDVNMACMVYHLQTSGMTNEECLLKCFTPHHQPGISGTGLIGTTHLKLNLMPNTKLAVLVSQCFDPCQPMVTPCHIIMHTLDKKCQVWWNSQKLMFALMAQDMQLLDWDNLHKLMHLVLNNHVHASLLCHHAIHALNIIVAITSNDFQQLPTPTEQCYL